MPEITLSEEQIEYLEGLREYIAQEHVGRYGHVRMRETVQFLIDRYDAEERAEREMARRVVEEDLADRSYQELQSLAADTEGVEPGGKAGDLRERLVEARADELLIDVESHASDGTETAFGGDDAADGGEERPDPSTDGSAASSEGSSAGSGTDEDEGADGGGSRLERMMGLLDQHDDSWEETDSEEGRYAVTLPDGRVEHVRTKDDVRATLFKHYD